MSSISACLRTPIWALSIAASTLAGAAASVSHAAIFGADDRARLPPAQQILRGKIGILNSSATGAVCSAFCLSPDVIATAGHCIFGASQDKAPPLESLSFYLSGQPPVVIAGRATANQSQNIIAGAGRLSLAPPIGAANDWAAVKLETPACRAGGLELAQSPSGAAADAYHVAFHRDTAATDLQFQSGCALGAATPGAGPDILARDFANWRAIRLHTCDTGGGSSGSPMLRDHDGTPLVVAVNVGTYVAARGLTSASTANGALREPIANTAISVAPLATAFAMLQARDLLQTKDEISAVQRRLKTIMLYGGDITGVVDDRLFAAVRAYERKHMQPVTGLLTRALLTELAAPSASE